MITRIPFYWKTCSANKLARTLDCEGYPFTGKPALLAQLPEALILQGKERKLVLLNRNNTATCTDYKDIILLWQLSQLRCLGARLLVRFLVMPYSLLTWKHWVSFIQVAMVIIRCTFLSCKIHVSKSRGCRHKTHGKRI